MKFGKEYRKQLPTDFQLFSHTLSIVKQEIRNLFQD